MCRQVQQDEKKAPCPGIERLGVCPEGKIPDLSPTNKEFWRVFAYALPGFIKADGYDYGAVKMVFSDFSVSKHRRPFYMDRVLAIINVIDRVRKK